MVNILIDWAVISAQKAISCSLPSEISVLLYASAVGPVYETDDPYQFMQHMEKLMALGGGDEPEMCLSAIQVTLDAVSLCNTQGNAIRYVWKRVWYENCKYVWQLISPFAVCLQLALTHSPPLSEIFVFTDASPKDAHLFDAVKALTLEKQSKVGSNFKDDLSLIKATLCSVS